MITWPWQWKRRALSAEAENVILRDRIEWYKENCLRELEKFCSERDTLQAEVVGLRAQVRQMSDRRGS